MAYNDKALRVEFGTGSYGASPDGAKFFRHATYITADSPATLEAASYFNDAAKRLPKNTVIEAVMSASGTPVLKHYVVTSNDGSTVAIAIQEASAGLGVAGSSMVLQKSGVSSKASDAAVARWYAPFKGRIVEIESVLNAALATGNATITFAIDGVAVTGGVITATQASSAAGDRDEATPSALNTFAKGALITATVGGASTATATVDIQAIIEETP